MQITMTVFVHSKKKFFFSCIFRLFLFFIDCLIFIYQIIFTFLLIFFIFYFVFHYFCISFADLFIPFLFSVLAAMGHHNSPFLARNKEVAL